MERKSAYRRFSIIFRSIKSIWKSNSFFASLIMMFLLSMAFVIYEGETTQRIVRAQLTGIIGYSGQPDPGPPPVIRTCSNCHSGGTPATTNVTIEHVSPPLPVNVGETHTYRVTITGGPLNRGGFNVSANGGTFNENLSDGVRKDGGELTHTNPKTPTSGEITFEFTWDATATGTFTMWVAGVSGNGMDGSGGDGVDTDTLPIIVEPPPADLSSSEKQASDTTPDAGSTFNYTIQIENTGGQAATGVTVVDDLPDGIVLDGTITIDPPEAGTVGTPPDVASISQIDPGDTVDVIIPVRVDANIAHGTSVLNSATIDLDRTNPLIRSRSVTVQNAELTLTKTASNSAPHPNEVITYTIQIENTGALAATNLIVTDSLPSDVDLEGVVTCDVGCDIDVSALPTIIINGFNDLNPTEQVMIMIPVRIKPGVDDETPVTNDISASAMNANGGSVTATESSSITVRRSDLSLVKGVSDSTPNPGDTIDYIITIENNGTGSAENGAVTDNLPTEFVDLNGSITINPASAGTVGTPPELITDLIVNGDQTVEVIVPVQIKTEVENNTLVTNSASITATGGTAIATDDVTLTVQRSALSLSKTASDIRPNPGDVLTYTITIRNNGDANATNGVVIDELPSTLTLTGTGASTITLDPPSAGTIGLPPTIITGLTVITSEVVTISIPVQVKADVPNNTLITNTATVTTTGGGTASDSGTASVTVFKSELEVEKIASELFPNPGDLITYTITVRNIGDGDASGITVVDTLPQDQFDSIGPITSTITDDAFSGILPTLLMNFDLDSGQHFIITIPARLANDLDDNTLITNTVTVTATDDVNSATVALTVARPALSMIKAIDDPMPGNDGALINYTITITNDGPGWARGVTISDPLPTGLTLTDIITFDPPDAGKTDSPSPILAYDIAIPPGEAVKVFVPVQVTASITIGTKITNTASVTANAHPELNDSVTLTVFNANAELSLIKQTGNLSPETSSTVQYTVVITNRGLSDATNTLITDLLPPEVDFVGPIILNGMTVSPVSIGPPTLILDDDLTIQALSMVTLTYSVRVNEDLPQNTLITNTVTVTSPDTASPVSISLVITAIRPPPMTIMAASRDNTLYEDELGALSNGAGEFLFAGTNNLIDGAKKRRALIVFEGIAEKMPPGARILSATLMLQVSKGLFSNPQPISLHKVLADWGEATSVGFGQQGSGGFSTIGDATWQHASYPYQLWTAVGGDAGGHFEPTASATQMVPNAGLIIWQSDPMSMDIQSWLDNPDKNFGWLLIGNETGHTTTRRFNSRENASNPPKLIVSFAADDLVLHKRVNNLVPKPGEIITYTIRVTNFSDDHVHEAVISNPLPSGLSLANPVTLDSPNHFNGHLAQSDADLPVLVSGLAITVGRTITLTVPVSVSTDIVSGTSFKTVASLTSAEFTDPFTQALSIRVIDVDLSIDKSVNHLYSKQGSLITYTIVISNNASSTATNLRVLDELQSGLIFNGSVTLDPPDNNVVLAQTSSDLPTLAENITLEGGQSVTLTLGAVIDTTIPNGSQLKNIVTITSTEAINPIGDEVTVTVATASVYLPIIMKSPSNN